MPTRAGDPWQAAVDHQHLRLVALGVEPGEPRARAIVALAQTAVPSRVGDLEAILRDDAAPMPLRHLAAILLGKIDHGSARDALMGALDTSDSRLVGRVAQSLGRIDDRAAFEPIQRVSSKLTGVALTQARFALRLIAHRHDLDLPKWPDDDTKLLPKPGDDAQTFAFGPADPIEAQIAARSLAREPFGIDLSERTASLIRCDGSRLMLLLNRRLTEGLLDSLRSKKQLAGIVGRSEETDGLYSPALVVLTAPGQGGEQVTVSLYQPNGTLALTGSAAPAAKDKGLAFELRSVACRGGVAMHIKGSIVADRISVTTARTGCARRDIGRPGTIPPRV